MKGMKGPAKAGMKKGMSVPTGGGRENKSSKTASHNIRLPRGAKGPGVVPGNL